jgi:hypothetical protein
MFGNRDGWYVDDIMLRAIASSVEESPDRDIMIYPNPASDYATVRCGNPISADEIAIRDMLGRKYAASSAVNMGSATEITLHISHLPAGVYLIEIIDKNSGNIHRRLLSVAR